MAIGDLDRGDTGWYFGSTMDILDQVARLVSEYDTAEKKQRASLELGKANLLRAAADNYVKYIRQHEWESAREQLERILLAVVNMIPYVPSDESKDE